MIAVSLRRPAALPRRPAERGPGRHAPGQLAKKHSPQDTEIAQRGSPFRSWLLVRSRSATLTYAP
eukprot:627411-Pyramimonas_sp.AAC.1